jgi:hypothetical protein
VGGAALSSDSDQAQASANQRETIIAAAALLLDVAGLANEHIQMSRSGDAKYYTVYRPLRLDVKPDLTRQLDGAALTRLRENTTVGHLLGATTLGALLWRPDGMTRALCFDEDDEQGWNVLKEAARRSAFPHWPLSGMCATSRQPWRGSSNTGRDLVRDQQAIRYGCLPAGMSGQA